MEKFYQLLQLDCTEVDKENAIQTAFNEEFLRVITAEDMCCLLQGSYVCLPVSNRLLI